VFSHHPARKGGSAQAVSMQVEKSWAVDKMSKMGRINREFLGHGDLLKKSWIDKSSGICAISWAARAASSCALTLRQSEQRMNLK
jgi:hypothetical protein